MLFTIFTTRKNNKKGLKEKTKKKKNGSKQSIELAEKSYIASKLPDSLDTNLSMSYPDCYLSLICSATAHSNVSWYKLVLYNKIKGLYDTPTVSQMRAVQ